jgi:hypothetical protein
MCLKESRLSGQIQKDPRFLSRTIKVKVVIVSIFILYNLRNDNINSNSYYINIVLFRSVSLGKIIDVFFAN